MPGWLIDKVKAIMDSLPEADRITIVKMYSSTWNGQPQQPPLSPRVQKMVNVFNWLSDEEKKQFWGATYGQMKDMWMNGDNMNWESCQSPDCAMKSGQSY